MGTRTSIRFGRNTEAYHENDVSIDDPTVSRVHMLATLINDNIVEIRDLGSANGTFVNNRRLQKDKPVRIGPNDQVALAKLEIVVNPFKFLLPERVGTNLINAPQPANGTGNSPEDPLDKSSEFRRIEEEWHHMTEEIKSLRRKFQIRMSLLQGTVSFAPSIIILLFAKDNPLLSSMSGIITGFLVILTGVIRIKPGEQLEEKIRDINENIRDIYKCPGVKNNRPCAVRFAPMERPSVYKKQETCANCNARYTKNK